jgi:hypothetical protein
MLEGSPASDRSAVGLYLGDRPPKGGELRSLAIADSRDTPPAGAPRKFAATVPSAIDALAVRPSLDRVYDAIELVAYPPGGSAVTLLRLHRPRPDWPRRYWLASPARLPKGTRLEVVATLPPDTTNGDPRDAVSETAASSPARLGVDVDYVSRPDSTIAHNGFTNRKSRSPR